ncbi:hypothetical protein V2J09_021383 [Rumex salicifolius]
MGFHSVYRTLQELFPQVDVRLLKAAAIEHSHDPDASVEFILTEVLPFTTEQFSASACKTQSLGCLSSVANEKYCVPRPAVTTCATSPDHASTSFVGEASNGSGEMNKTSHVHPACMNEAIFGFSGSTEEAVSVSEEIKEPCHVDPICLNWSVNGSLHLTFGDAKDIGYLLSGSTVKAADGEGRVHQIFHADKQSTNEAVSSLDPTVSDSNDIGDQLSPKTQNTTTEKFKSSSSFVEDAIAAQDVLLKNILVSHTSEEVYNGDCICSFPSEINGLEDGTAANKKFDLPDTSFSSLVSSAVLKNDPLSNSLNDSNLVHNQNEHSRFDRGLSCGSNHKIDLTSLSVEDHRLESIGCSIQSEVQNNMIAFDDKISEYHETANIAFMQDIQVPDSANIEESSSLHSVLTRSGQLCQTGLLQDIILDSKTLKKTLFSAMESVLKLMKEVEIEEEIAQQAKEEAVKGGFEIHAKVEELKKMLNRAREANDMHSGEVYGERAILATEMRELQSRLLILSDEKDNSLSILNMMRQDLETRLASAEAERIAAEKDKSEKEESARRALVEQELIMEKVVQESKTLLQEAEENAKLREFLVDRGHVVDTLQGEICVICEDVKLLKEKYDAKVPLSACLSSKQTSCILASSGSSSKSTASEKAVEKPNWPSSPNQSFPILSVNQALESDQDESSLEAGWELF